MVSCRSCRSELKLTLIDLGSSPIANNLIPNTQSMEEIRYFPLCAKTCENCSLVQLSEELPRETLFRSDYVYHSSYSSSWLEHSRSYVRKMVNFLNLSENDLVVEVASNDGYLLQFFADSKVQVLGIEPAAGVANLAIAKNIPTMIEFFGVTTAKKLAKNPKPKLIIGNNVLAHVPDLHDFIEGFSILVADEGIITFEFPHLLNLLKNNQFDTIYHEHYSYLNVTALLPLVARYKLKIINVEKLPTHGGSLRVFIAKNESNWATDRSVQIMLKEEAQYDPRNKKIYESFQKNILNLKSNLVNELLRGKESKKRIAAYGAAAKGVTLLNYCGIKSDLIDYVVDLNPNKQGNFLPGCQIPIVGSDTLVTNPPDILLILAWNLSNEIKSQLLNQLNGGMKMLRAIPNVEYF
jgi:hypothetical protein